MKNKKNKMNEANEFEKRVREEINKMHDDGVVKMFNDGKKVIMDDNTFINLIVIKVEYDMIVNNLKGLEKQIGANK